jgi:hypothetical protein
LQTYEEFLTKLHRISDRGWVRTHRKGPTGIGKTIEDLLGIEENNVPGPDGELVELKSARKHSTAVGSMLTLFTKSPDSRGANSVLLDKFGYKVTPDSPTKELHTTLSAVSYNTLRGFQGLRINVGESRVEVVGVTARRTLFDDNSTPITPREEAYCFWSREVLQETFERKLPRLLYVKADFRGAGEDEEFWFNEAELLQDFRFENFLQQLQQGNILVDIRIGQWPPGHPQAGRPHDHGTAFRVYPDNLSLCFARRTRVL